MVPEAGMNLMLSRVTIRPVQASDGAELVTATAFRTFFDLLEPDLVESPSARSASDDAAALETRAIWAKFGF